MLISANSPAVVLAPMEGITDSPMRDLLTRVGYFSYTVSEFLRVSIQPLPAKVFRAHVPELESAWRTPMGITVLPQLLGGNPERLALTAALATKELGAPGIDLNFGCPAPTVNRHDGGATLLLYPDRLEGIVRAVRDAVPSHLPVSAKLRLGWSDERDIFRNAEAAARGGASWITIHARTKLRGYAPPVDWEKIGEVRKKLSIPVVANGDIWTREDFLRCRELTGCEHFMLGRGAVANPALSWEVAYELGLAREIRRVPDWPELITIFTQICAEAGENINYPLNRTKQWLKLAASRNRFSAFESVKQCNSLPELFEQLGVLVSRHRAHGEPIGNYRH